MIYINQFRQIKSIWLIIIMITFMCILPIVSALDFDNAITYKDNDMKVEFTNSFGLGEKLGEATLKSHTAINIPNYVSVTEKGAVMYYDMNFADGYEGGLGDVKFIDLYTGKEEVRDYHFVIGTINGYDTYYETNYSKCTSTTGKNGTYDSCEQYKVEKPVYKWETLESKDVPRGDNILGIVVEDLRFGESFDAIWTIAGKEVTRHAIISVYDAHGKTMSLDSENTASRAGVWILPNKNITLQEVVLNYIDSDFTNCYVINSSQNVIETRTPNPTTHNVTMNSNLTEGKYYAIACNGTSSWGRNNWGCGTATTGVINQTNINWSSGYQDTSTICDTQMGFTNTFSWGINILAIRSFTGTPDVNETMTITDVLNYPLNNTLTTNKQQNFVGTFNVTFGNLTNATLNIWKAGVLTYSNFTTLSGNGTTANLSIKLQTGTYKWNYYVCAINATATECKYSQANNTLYINNPTFGLCNSTNSIPYINYSFKDEIGLFSLNSTLSSSFNFYDNLDSSDIFSYSYISTAMNNSYAFCGNLSSNQLTISPTISYSSTGYPSRNYFSGYSTYTNLTTNTTLYLLSTSDGLYQTIVVTGSGNTVVGGALVTAKNNIGSIVGIGTTDSNGQVQLWLNPNTAHTITTTATGYPTDVRIINPSSTIVYISLSGSASIPANISITYTEGISYTILPTNEYLENGTSYNFGFDIVAGTYTISNFGFVLYNSTNDIIGSDNDTTNGGSTSVNLNVGDNTKITIVAYWTSNSTNNTVSYTWIVMNTADNSYSILHLGNRIKTYISSGMFGLTTGFGLNLFCFVIILITTGVISYKYGLNNPILISIIATLLVAFFELGLGLIQMGAGKVYLTAWASLAVVASIIREVLT